MLLSLIVQKDMGRLYRVVLMPFTEATINDVQCRTMRRDLKGRPREACTGNISQREAYQSAKLVALIYTPSSRI
jgi:hypothetical protein